MVICSTYCRVLAYADDFTLLSYSQRTFNVCLTSVLLMPCFANEWHYTHKFSVLVIGESTNSRARSRSLRYWTLGEYRFLNVTRSKTWSVSGSSLGHTSSVLGVPSMPYSLLALDSGHCILSSPSNYLEPTPYVSYLLGLSPFKD